MVTNWITGSVPGSMLGSERRWRLIVTSLPDPCTYFVLVKPFSWTKQRCDFPLFSHFWIHAYLYLLHRHWEKKFWAVQLANFYVIDSLNPIILCKENARKTISLLFANQTSTLNFNSLYLMKHISLFYIT